MYPIIIDFGFAKNCNDNIVCGTIIYIAPEIHEERDYGKPIDVFSFGMTIYSIVTSLIPFPNVKIQFKISHCGKPQLYPKILKCHRDLIEKCWCQEPKERPIFDEIVELLRSDPSYITEDVDQEEFDKYVQYIDESKRKHTNNDDPHNLFETIELDSYFYYRNRPKHIDTDLQEFEHNDYEKLKEIGQGSFGKVYKIKLVVLWGY